MGHDHPGMDLRREGVDAPRDGRLDPLQPLRVERPTEGTTSEGYIMMKLSGTSSASRPGSRSRAGSQAIDPAPRAQHHHQVVRAELAERSPRHISPQSSTRSRVVGASGFTESKCAW
jgi:hypothetical protein